MCIDDRDRPVDYRSYDLKGNLMQFPSHFYIFHNTQWFYQHRKYSGHQVSIITSDLSQSLPETVTKSWTNLLHLSIRLFVHRVQHFVSNTHKTRLQPDNKLLSKLQENLTFKPRALQHTSFQTWNSISALCMLHHVLHWITIDTWCFN